MKTIEQQIIAKYKELVKLLESYLHIKMSLDDWHKWTDLDKDLTKLEAQLKEQEEPPELDKDLPTGWPDLPDND